MNNCPFCGAKVKMVAPCVFVCEHKVEEFPEQNLTLIFITNMENVLVYSIKKLK